MRVSSINLSRSCCNRGNEDVSAWIAIIHTDIQTGLCYLYEQSRLDAKHSHMHTNIQTGLCYLYGGSQLDAKHSSAAQRGIKCPKCGDHGTFQELWGCTGMSMYAQYMCVCMTAWLFTT